MARLSELVERAHAGHRSSSQEQQKYDAVKTKFAIARQCFDHPVGWRLIPSLLEEWREVTAAIHAAEYYLRFYGGKLYPVER